MMYASYYDEEETMLSPFIVSELARARAEHLQREAERVARGRRGRRPRALAAALPGIRDALSPASTWARLRAGREVVR